MTRVSSTASFAPVVSCDPPRAAYLHVPFCAHRCGYCNFTLVAGRDDLIEAYLSALETELSWLGEPRPVETLFLGGGTPTHLPAPALAHLLAIVARWFPLASGGEYSVEANPIDIDAARVEALAQAGVKRVSLGAQSFDAAKLALLERDHRAEHIVAAVERLRPFVSSLSLDLIFGAPGESLIAWQADLEAALALKPDHLSTYGLTFERGTTFWSRRLHGALASVDEEAERAMYCHTIERLGEAGFEHYEVSNFARPGHRCRHNETYWAAASYYAAGPGAARYVDGRREVNHRSTTTYIRRVLSGQSPVAEAEQLDDTMRAREALVLAMRRLRGVERQAFARQTGFEVDRLIGRELPDLVERGLLEDTGPGVRLTRAGLLVSDAIWSRLLRG